MARAKAYLIPGFIWHLTHRCHDRAFLLKFNRDRKRWLHWLFEAKKRYGLIILNYTLTSNHIHLLVFDEGQRDAIPRSIQLVAGRTAREFNIRKKRSGAFWEDQYHATAVESGEHMARCMIYIDMNMVRARVVNHPRNWPFCGYNEIVGNRQRYTLIDKSKLCSLLHLTQIEDLKDYYATLAETGLEKAHVREEKWTESLAVGSQKYVQNVKDRLGISATHREVEEVDGAHLLRDKQIPYRHDFSTKIDVLSESDQGDK